MSLNAPLVYVVPEDTEAVARLAFPADHPHLLISEELGLLYSNSQFTSLFSLTGQPALDPARLALVLVFQFMEGLSDEQAANAVRARIDWKYALALPLGHRGFDPSVLCEFRARLLAGSLEMSLLDTLLEKLRERGLVKARGRARTDSTHVLAAVRTTTRLVTCGETLRAALNTLAEEEPEWLSAQVTPEWFRRYGRRVEEYQLPKTKQARSTLAATIGADGQRLLNAVYGSKAPASARHLAQVQVLRAVWVQQFHAPTARGGPRLREHKDQPPSAQQILSPYDPEARLSVKRDLHWVGYKVHLTETCDEDTPHLITHVETTPATTQDEQALAPIHEALAGRELLPAEHLVDAGYVDSERLVSSRREHEVELVGPAPADGSWQARAGKGYGAGYFAVDWEARKVTCPEGQQSREWKQVVNERGKEEIHVEFGRATCEGCGVRELCTKAKGTGRTLHIGARASHVALEQARAAQQTGEFKRRYAARAGIEGTLSQGMRVGDIRQARYRGQAKTRLQQILIAVGINLLRLVAWWQKRPRAQTRISAFAALAGRYPLASAAAG